MSIKEQVNDAEAFHVSFNAILWHHVITFAPASIQNSKHSHELLEKSMEDMKEAGHNHLRAKNKARNVLVLVRVGSEPQVIRELRLPQEGRWSLFIKWTLNESL